MHKLAFTPVLLLLACSSSGAPSSHASAGNGGGGASNAPSEDAGASGTRLSEAGEAGSLAQSPCEAERARLEQSMAQTLDAAALDPDVTAQPNFTIALEAEDRHRFVHTHGDSSLDAEYESASTSKWVSAAVILDLVDRGVLKLSDDPAQYLPFWQAAGVTLAHLLSFTSGFSQEAPCVNQAKADFADCVQQLYQANSAPPPPGSAFDYSSTHLQIAGLMAVRAANVDGWSDLFADWQARTGLFENGRFDLPSASNPRLAGGMHWTGAEYLQFLRAIGDGAVLDSATRHAMLDNQRGAALVVGSPTIDALNQDWAYGFGNWLECPSALGPNTFDCGAGHRNSSPGAYGAYPFIDFDHHYLGMLAQQGTLGSFRDGNALFQTIAADAALWADACDQN